MRVPSICLLALALSLAAPGASAQLFKWIDEDGVVNYGDWPPSDTKLQPITHGTVSSVAGAPKEPTAEMRAPSQQRRPQRARQDRDPPATTLAASAPSDDAQYVEGYTPIHGYPARRARAAELDNRPRADQPIANPTVPLNLPAIPDMPLRPRR